MFLLLDGFEEVILFLLFEMLKTMGLKCFFYDSQRLFLWGPFLSNRDKLCKFKKQLHR